MATGPRYTVRFRRRRDGSTNYQKRLALLKSRKPRLVIRKTNKYIICQVLLYDPKGDKVVASANSKELVKLGWKGATANLPAAYLTGLLIAKKAKKAKVSEAIADLGLYNSTKGSKIYATLKGVIDGGLNVPAGEENFPTEDRIAGKHLKTQLKDFEAMKKKVKA